MAVTLIDLTTPQPGGKFGDPTKTAWEKANDNFTELAAGVDKADPQAWQAGSPVVVEAAYPDVPGITTAGQNIPALDEQTAALVARTDFLLESVQSALAVTNSLVILDGPELNGETDGTALLHGFLNKVIATGGRGTCPRGGVLRVSSSFTRALTADQKFIVDLSGLRIVQTGNHGILSLTNTGAISPVTAVATVQKDLGNGSTNSTVSRITVSGHSFVVGDVGKIFSDDLCEFRENDNQREGEFFVVGAVEGAEVYTTATLMRAYSAGVKVVKPSNANVAIANLSVESVIQDSITASAVTVGGFLWPTVAGFRARNMNATALNMVGNYMGAVLEPDGTYMKNRPDLGAYGYFINDSSGYLTTVSKPRCSYARHAYTTTTGSTQAGDNNWINRGSTYYPVISEGSAQGCAVPWDTHGPCVGVDFVDCYDAGGYRGNDTGGASFQLRGQACRVTRGRSRNAKIGATVSGAYATQAQRAYLDVDYVGGVGCLPVQLNNANGSFEQSVDLSGRLEGTSSPLVELRGSLVEESGFPASNARALGVDYVPQYTQNGGAVVSLVGKAAYTSRGGRLNMSGVSGTGHVIVRHADPNSAADVSDLDVYGNSGKLQYVAQLDAFDAVSRWRRLNLESSLPGVGFLTSITLTKASLDYRNAANQQPLGYRVFTYGAAGARSLDIQYSSHPTVVVRLEVTVDGVTLNSVTKGAFAGQELRLMSRTASAFPLAISTSSGGNLSIPSGVTLAPGSGITLVYDGSNWNRAG